MTTTKKALTTVQVLTRARTLIVKGWTKNRFHCKGRYCAGGAVDAVHYLHQGAFNTLCDAMGATRSHGAVFTFNDAQKTKAPVLALFDKAIALAKTQVQS